MEKKLFSNQWWWPSGGVCDLFQTSTFCPLSASPRACWTCCVSRWDTATAAFKPCSPPSTPSSFLCAPQRWQACTAGQDVHAAPLLQTLPSFGPASPFVWCCSELKWFLSPPPPCPSAPGRQSASWPIAAPVTAFGPLTCRDDAASRRTVSSFYFGRRQAEATQCVGDKSGRHSEGSETDIHWIQQYWRQPESPLNPSNKHFFKSRHWMHQCIFTWRFNMIDSLEWLLFLLVNFENMMFCKLKESDFYHYNNYNKTNKQTAAARTFKFGVNLSKTQIYSSKPPWGRGLQTHTSKPKVSTLYLREVGFYFFFFFTKTSWVFFANLIYEVVVDFWLC